LTLLVFFSCEQSDRLNTDTKLEEKIKKGVTSREKTLNIGELADFKWDSLLILTPYVNPDLMEVQYGINLSKIKHTGIKSRDDINQMIFFDNRQPVNMVEDPIYPGDFSNNKVEFIQRDSAIFDIIITRQKTIKGDDWIELTQLGLIG
jgi:hypothetical protein